jgi:hypothetical protein
MPNGPRPTDLVVDRAGGRLRPAGTAVGPGPNTDCRRSLTASKGAEKLTASIGIWAHGDPADDVVLYRWEANGHAGFVTFEVTTRRIRPAEPTGRPIGDLRYDPAEGEAVGTASGVDRRLFNEGVVAILRAYRRTGAAPRTAHAYYY